MSRIYETISQDEFNLTTIEFEALKKMGLPLRFRDQVTNINGQTLPEFQQVVYRSEKLADLVNNLLIFTDSDLRIRIARWISLRTPEPIRALISEDPETRINRVNQILMESTGDLNLEDPTEKMVIRSCFCQAVLRWQASLNAPISPADKELFLKPAEGIRPISPSELAIWVGTSFDRTLMEHHKLASELSRYQSGVKRIWNVPRTTKATALTN